MKEKRSSDKTRNVISFFAIGVFAVALFFFLFFSTNLLNQDASSRAQIRKVDKQLQDVNIPEIPEIQIDERIQDIQSGNLQIPQIPSIVDYELIAHDDYPGFAAKEFSINGKSLSISDKLIYERVYYSINGAAWEFSTLTGTRYQSYPFLLDYGEATLPNTLDNQGTHFVIIFSCSLVNQAWDCHGDSPGEAKWQLEVITNQGSNNGNSGSVAEFAQCVTNQGAVMYGTHTCGSCQTQKSYFGDDFQYINFVDCATRGSECDAAGIDSFPTWIINGQKYGLSDFQRLSGNTGCPVPN